MHRNDEITSVQSKPGKSPQYQTSEEDEAATTWLIMRAPMNIPLILSGPLVLLPVYMTEVYEKYVRQLLARY